MKRFLLLLLSFTALAWGQKHDRVRSDVRPSIAAPHPFPAEGCNQNTPLDVKTCFAAKGDGIADDTAALQDALDHAGPQGVFCPPGTYAISKTLMVGVNYPVSGTRSSCNIKAKAGFNGTAMISVIGAPNVQIQGGLRDLFVDCNNVAAVGVAYGGTGPNKGVWAYETRGVLVRGCKTAGFQTGDNTFILSFENDVGWANRDGFQVLSSTNAGENISLRSCFFAHNTNNGLTIFNGGPDGSAHTIFVQGSSFDYNDNWQIQNGGTPSPGEISLVLTGDHIESAAKWLLNYGWATLDGVEFYNGGNSAALGYLIDNEGMLSWTGGRNNNNGGGALFRPGEGGVTNISSVIGFNGSTYNTVIDQFGQTDYFPNVNIKGLYQKSANSFAGKCTMSSATTCTFGTNSTYTNYVSFASIDHASAPPPGGISATCSISGTTATIAAGTPNSLTWDCVFIGNPH